jgi:hypothetical protein
MGQTVRFQETLRRQAMIDEGFVEDEARLGLAAASALDPMTTALLHVGVPVAIGVTGGVPGMERRPGAGGGRE